MLSQELYDQIEVQERRALRKSAILTLLLFLTSSAAILVYELVRDPLLPPGEKEYEVMGSIDFGNYQEGSRKVNNFQPPVENPVEQPQEVQEAEPEPTPPQPQAAQPQPAPPAETTPTPTQEVTSSEPQEVTAPEPQETKPDPAPPASTTPAEPTPKPTTNDNSSNTSTTTPSSSSPSTTPTTNSQSGSNHGNASSGTGNAGTPDVKTLDPNGLYSFGQGSGGLKGRGVLKLGDPAYNAQQEGILEFRFRIEPNGTVSYVQAMPTTKTALKNAGIAAIKKWKFTSVPAGQGEQWVTVKITFRLN